MKVRYKALSIIAVLAFLLSLLPTLPVGAVQGTITLDKTAYTNLEIGSNIALVTVTDADLDVPRDLVTTANPNGVEIVRDATTLKIFTVTNTPVRATSVLVTALQDGALYPFASVTPGSGVIETIVDTKQETLYRGALSVNPTVFASVGTVTAVPLAATETNPLRAPTRLKVTIVHDGVGAAGLTAVTLTITGRTVNNFFANTEEGVGATPTSAADSNVSETVDVIAYTLAAVADAATTATLLVNHRWAAITNIAITTTGDGGYSLRVDETFTIGVDYLYDAADTTNSGTTKTVKATSTTNATGLSLTLTETGNTTGIFTKQVALINTAKLDTINIEILTEPLAPATDTIDELVTALTAGTPTAAQTAAATWTTTTIANLTGFAGGDFIQKLLDATMRVEHGDTLTLTYSDANGLPATKTASIDALAPVITSASPARSASLANAQPLFGATVTDADQGIDSTGVLLCIDAGAACTTANDVNPDTVVKNPITGGFSVLHIPASGLGQGAHHWELAVVDRVGNKATTGVGSSTTARINFTVDTVKPVFQAAVTGTGIKLDSADLDADGKTTDYIEFLSREWIKLTFDEAMDTATVAPEDFEITSGSGAATSALVQGEVSNAAGTAELATPKRYVYLRVAELAGNAKPKVHLAATTGTVSDLAGNAITRANVTELTATDGIKPAPTAAVSATLGKSLAVITITSTSDEPVSSIQVKVATAGGDVFPAVTPAGTNAWTSTYTIGAPSFKYTVTVTATDTSSNVGTATRTFEGDVNSPTVVILAVGEVGGKVEEGAVWVESTFNDLTPDGPYTGDTHTRSTVSAAKLETLSAAGGTVTASADVLTALFPTGAATKFTLARNLTPGFYKLTITAADDAGNSVTGTHAFEVVVLAKTVIAIKPGLNLISLPGEPSDGAINTVIKAADPIDLVVYYDGVSKTYKVSQRDATTGLFTGAVTTLSAGKAYWVRASAAFDLSVAIPPQEFNVLPPSISVVVGYNAVGVWTIADELAPDADAYLGSVKWTVAYTFDPTPGIGWKVIRPNGTDPVEKGKGYLVYVTEAGLLTP